jgi:hypothetical protein
MGELLPVALGLVVGFAVVRLRPQRAKGVWFVVGCLGTGALASGLNGELDSGAWELFVSFDAAQAWLGATCGVTVSRLAGRSALARRARL